MKKTFKTEKPKKVISPIAQFMADNVINQIINFLDAPTDEDREELAPNLFSNIKYDCHLSREDGPEGVEECQVFLLQSSTNWSVEHKRRISMDLIVTSEITHRPMFFMKAFIAGGDRPYAALACYEYGEYGAIYHNTLRWNSKDRDE